MQNKFTNLSSPLANKLETKGDEYLYFGGTAYLGIPQHQLFTELYLKGLKKYGLNNGTSRGNNVQLGIYNEVEKYAADRYGAQDALITSSGYLAAQLTVKEFSKYGEIRYAPNSHPALWQNEAPKIDTTFKDWSVNIIEEINKSDKENWLIISNSMNNLYPEIYDFSFVKQLNKRTLLIIDDSHGIGINNNGSGAYTSIPQSENIEVVVVASMAKALGVDAGLILGSAKNIGQLKKSNEFLGASPPSAAGLYAFKNADDIYKKELNTINLHIDSLSKLLYGNPEWHFIPKFPVFFSKNADLSIKLLEKNILVSSFPYPDKDGPIVNRIVLSSWHTQTDIQKLIEAL
ncbi:MAG: aminotransferase class I/II-fold pyridoxal phosphate-dependent enzyme [Pedobacter sp.]|nr:MAG: aminotransferase class I/II-fold pyridoxal phosphate-dependent enzyme [Pedobacter sp.]